MTLRRLHEGRQEELDHVFVVTDAIEQDETLNVADATWRQAASRGR